MEIIKNTAIRDKYHKGFDRPVPISEIVIHGTGGGTGPGLLRWMLKDGRPEYHKGVALFHYLIDRNGDVTEIIDPEKWVYHSSSGKHDMRTIGIELINPKPDNSASYTKAQYKALEDLIFNGIMLEYDIKTIVGHGKNKEIYSKKYKVCPGPQFNWEYISGLLTKYGYIFNDEGELFKIGA